MTARLLYLVNIPRFFMTHRLPLALAAREAGYEVHVATSQYDRANVERIRATGLAWHGLPLQQHGANPFSEIRALRSIHALYRALRPDLTHHITVKSLLYGGLAARLGGVPAVVNTVSGLGYIFSSEDLRARVLRGPVSVGYRALLRHPNSRTIFQNPDDCEQFLRRGLVREGQTCVIRGSGVDMTRFVPRPEPDDIPRVLYAGRLLWQKGLAEFVEAARLLRAEAFPARFTIAGYGEAGNPDSVPQATLASWQREGVIDYLGQRDDMPQVYADAQVVCLPSWREGVPLALIEGAACSRALVASDVPGCREIVRHEHNGLLVAPRDAASLAAALRRLLTDEVTRQRMGAAGRELARREFSLEQVISTTLSLYDGLLGSSCVRN
ncbi:MAG: glycosyltransferase family 4 protein [Anaerolineaceae bacterium]|nr:glycosyltransferase family 4 protein [Anaerolineaceae bacterium]